ncbi:uncharacterized protein LOC123554689 [Mercenaria mercenaria]|uniref:uncharacterized protein LOC123554689 n=1 Tax=Mercenaria mercenaria TaxID=6596 RepID=UPI00234FB351|nr:uncharacterized protein LOC123554689 [Mercenaria mercenaria]
MANQRRGRKGFHHDIINVTELDDDLEEFTLSSDINPSKSKTSTTIGHAGAATITGHVKTNYSVLLPKTAYHDPLKTISVKDPFAEKSKLNLDRNNKTPSSSFKLDNDLKRNTLQNTSAGQTGLNKDAVSTQNSPQVTKTTTTRGLASTPLNKNNPVTTTYITKRYNATPRVDKNKKGFSREEKDLYIDDIEDF